jgi:type I restriction enzyme M protein
MTDDYLTLTEVAKLAEVGISAASNWRSRHSDFPRPHLLAGQEKFAAAEVTNWLRARRIPKNALKDGEPPGTTYGDRVSRTHEPADTVRTTEQNQARSLSPAVNELRGQHDAALAVEHIFSLLYLKKTDPRRWQSLAGETDWEAVRDLLAHAEPPSWPGAPHISLLPPVDSMDRSSLRAVIRFIDGINLSGSKPVTGYFSDILLEQFERTMGRREGQFTPPSVVRCIVESLGQDLTGTVYDPFCGTGELLVAAAGRGRPRLFGQVANARSFRMTWLNTALHDCPADLRKGGLSPFDDTFADAKFDFVLANPPFNLAGEDFSRRSWPFGEPPRNNANFAWLQHIVGKLTPRGRAAVLMPNMTGMSRGPQDMVIRRGMVEAGVVDSVIALPPHLFRSTPIPTTLWVLRGIDPEASPSDIRFVDATTTGRMTDRTHRVLDERDVEHIVGGQHDRRVVSLEEVRANDYVLHPPVYLRRPTASRAVEDIQAEVESLTRELDHLRARAQSAELDPLAAMAITSANWEEVLLEEVCDVLAGPAKVDRSVDGTPEVPLVLPRNIRASRIAWERLDMVPRAVADRHRRHRLEAGDIVCVRTGTLGRYGQVGDAEAGWLVGPGCMRLRPTDAVDPGYLTYYLGAPDAYRWLEEHATGSVIRHITTGALRQLPVLLPPLAVQREIAAAIDVFDEQLATYAQISRTGEKLRGLIIPMLTARPGEW